MSRESANTMNYHRRRLIAMAAVWLFAAVFLWQAFLIPPPSRPTPVAASTFPLIVAGGMLLAASGMLFDAIRGFVRANRTDTPRDADPEDIESTGAHGEQRVASWPRLAVALGATAAYVLAFVPLGYLLSTFLFLTGMFWIFWRRSVWAVVISAAFAVAIAHLFSVLGISLPSGILPLNF